MDKKKEQLKKTSPICGLFIELFIADILHLIVSINAVTIFLRDSAHPVVSLERLCR